VNFLGIYREPEFSPGRHANNDARILRLVGQALEREGVTVRLFALEDARPLRTSADLIFSMCQGPRALQELASWKEEGCFILNDPAASRRTYRDTLCSTLREKELGFPHSEFLETSGNESLLRYRKFFGRGAWLKRADVHSTQTGDVVRLERFEELQSALQTFHARGLKQAVLQKHREGDEVKFYAVQGGRLFWPYYPKESEGYPFREKDLQTLAENAADTLEVGIYGGDAIISPDGQITLIDLNDWPSFAPCRGAAASAIAYYLKDAYHAFRDRREFLVGR
jgi:glutathione synthase/RimK-type ligase-like ATP-grasp enzyme